MTDLPKLLGNAGEPHAITHNGKTFKFRLIDQKAKDAVAKRLYQQARDAVYADKDRLTPDEYAAVLDRVYDRYSRGEFGFLTERTLGILKTPAGVLLLLSVLSGESDEDLAKLLDERGAEAQAVIKTILAESFPKKAVPAAEKPNG